MGAVTSKLFIRTNKLGLNHHVIIQLECPCGCTQGLVSHNDPIFNLNTAPAHIRHCLAQQNFYFPNALPLNGPHLPMSQQTNINYGEYLQSLPSMPALLNNNQLFQTFPNTNAFINPISTRRLDLPPPQSLPFPVIQNIALNALRLNNDGMVRMGKNQIQIPIRNFPF